MNAGIRKGRRLWRSRRHRRRHHWNCQGTSAHVRVPRRANGRRACRRVDVPISQNHGYVRFPTRGLMSLVALLLRRGRRRRCLRLRHLVRERIPYAGQWDLRWSWHWRGPSREGRQGIVGRGPSHQPVFRRRALLLRWCRHRRGLHGREDWLRNGRLGRDRETILVGGRSVRMGHLLNRVSGGRQNGRRHGGPTWERRRRRPVPVSRGRGQLRGAAHDLLDEVRGHRVHHPRQRLQRLQRLLGVHRRRRRSRDGEVRPQEVEGVIVAAPPSGETLHGGRGRGVAR